MEDEKIENIIETNFDGMDGFIVITNKQEIKLGICHYSQCCENWGYFMNEDNFDEFIGSQLNDIKIEIYILKSLGRGACPLW